MCLVEWECLCFIRLPVNTATLNTEYPNPNPYSNRTPAPNTNPDESTGPALYLEAPSKFYCIK